MYCKYKITRCQIKRAIPFVLCLTKRRANSVDLTCALPGLAVVICIGDVAGYRGDDTGGRAARRLEAVHRVEDVADAWGEGGVAKMPG